MKRPEYSNTNKNAKLYRPINFGITQLGGESIYTAPKRAYDRVKIRQGVDKFFRTLIAEKVNCNKRVVNL